MLNDSRNERRPVAVVSGGSSGLGKSFVAALHRRNYVVITCARDASKLRSLETKYPGVMGHVADVSDRIAMHEFATKVLSTYPTVDLLISNAGGLHEIDFTRSDLQDVDLSTELGANLGGAIHLITEFLPGLRRAGNASIVIVSSGYALAPATRAPIYSAAKAALHSLSKSLRRQLAPLNISVTEVAPPLVDTPAVAHRPGAKISPDQVAQLALDAASKGVKEVYPGRARWLPLMLRIAPSYTEGMVARS